MTRTAAVFAAVALIPLAGCQALGPQVVGSGVVASEDREVAGFRTIAVTGSGEVIITPGAAPALTIEAEDNLLPLIRSDVEGGKLTLGFKSNTWVKATKPIVFRLTVAELDAVSVAGSGTVTAGKLVGDKFDLSISGSGDATLKEIDVKALNVSLSGSGSFAASGSAGEATFGISGSGSVKAPDLAASAVTVKISGSGDADVRAAESLDVGVSGSGDVTYRGDPKVTKRISGSGSVTKKE
jgi:hypothetical protein